jgi:hypothetical protein
MGFVFGVFRIPGDIIQRTRVRAGGAGSCGIFPFGFGGQSVVVAIVLRVEPIQKILGFRFGYRFHGTVIAVHGAGIGFDDGAPLHLRHFKFSHLETPGDLNAVYGLFVVAAMIVTA